MIIYVVVVGGGGRGWSGGGGVTAGPSPAGRGALIGADPPPPYNRPPLSKGLWKGDPEDGIWRTAAKAGAELQLGRRVVGIDLRGHSVTDDRGTVYGFQKLLLATGGAPRRLPLESDQMIYFRTLDDYRRLRGLAEQRLRFTVVGGGFIGSEVAAALRLQGRDVVMLVPEAGLGARVFPADLSRFLVDYYRQKGVEVRTGEGMVGLESRGGKCVVRTTTQALVASDIVVAGLGIQPSVELAEQAGVLVENGIVVDEFCRSSHPDVYAAGDVASFPNPALGSRRRVEHEDNANTMGKIAGQNMAGRATPYTHLPFFYSDLFELGYEAVGELDSRLEAVADWKTPFREGVVYYLKAGRGRRVLLWETWRQEAQPRALITQPGPLLAADLQPALPVC